MKKFLLLTLILIVVGGVWAVLNFKTGEPVPALDGEAAPATTTAVAEIENPDVADDAGEKKNLPEYSGWPINNIGKDPFIAQVPKDYLEKYMAELKDLKKSLAENPDNADGWLKAGLLHKLFNNHIGARDMWEYGKLTSPNDHLFYYNLGVIYGSYLKNYEQAEKNYRQALAINPLLPYIYLGFADFYHTFYTEKADQAAEVIKKGIALLGEDPVLKEALENYSK